MRVLRQFASRENIKRLTKLSSGFAIFGLFFTGCAAVGPDYVPPEISTPQEWNTSLSGGLSAEVMDPQKMAKWWTILQDPSLTNLIERAVAGNLDLRAAKARVREARARRSIAGADRFPTINARGVAAVARSSEEVGSVIESDLYVAGFDANWELDLFGGVRRAVEASEAELAASHEDLHDVMVSCLPKLA